jgi:Pyruvate/2-oxoacid:ferredoxin oxidoreductase gamma subunit/pyruvate/2-oxoacid:ferredoxin oxidoreductase alpha subunit
LREKHVRLLLGNEAIAWGLIEKGCSVVTSYPGTPASEILGSIFRLRRDHGLPVHAEWSVNEKVAFEVALANSYLGARAAVSMKQVGLNVAADSLMSSAYTGVKGGFVVISADDPGPHSSQTEQDSRFMAMLAKIPVFDPASAREAKEMVGRALELSEQFQIPVMVRPTTRICHSRQDVPVERHRPLTRTPAFSREPGRWAATPKFRYLLHLQLNDKLARLAGEASLRPRLLNSQVKPGDTCVVASGVALANTREVMEQIGLLEKVPLYQVPVPYPLNSQFMEELLARFVRILVIEETYPVIELQFRQRERVFGRLSRGVPEAGEPLARRCEAARRTGRGALSPDCRRARSVQAGSLRTKEAPSLPPAIAKVTIAGGQQPDLWAKPSFEQGDTLRDEDMVRQQIVASGVGGQGVLFTTRILGEAALELKLPVLSSETHGMAQRGGTVTSHLKVGPFHSPLIRSGAADLLLALKSDNVSLHRHFLREGGLLIVNSSDESVLGAIDATAMALALKEPVLANLILLGFALSSGRLYCDGETVRRVLGRLLRGERLALSLKALELGMEWKSKKG